MRAVSSLFVLVLLFVGVMCANPCAQDSEKLNLHVPSPDWRDQVIYMVMTDRFDDGDSSNNDQGFGEFDPRKGSHFSGGDLAGVTRRVPYIKDLGATAVWITPPVLNQWWSKPYNATGWHGYWAVDFTKMDPHYGTLDEYKKLSHTLHCKDMYLVQDIVTNHVGNFYNYGGKFDPKDNSKNFRLLEKGSKQPAPTQYPFNLIDRNNPKHVKADIYKWTPTITDYSNDFQVKNYMLGYLADINTNNPLVIETFKKTYADWIRNVGVDAFRIDTVKFVEHEFWNKFLNDKDGIHEVAKQAGKKDFLTFGEVVDTSLPMKIDGEKKLLAYYGTKEKPEVKTMLGYPLYGDIVRVLGESKPTEYLGFRLKAMMSEYPDPHLVPNFVDNHDTPRFLSRAGHAAFKQSLAMLFTVPGIPILFQGTEHGLEESRQAMFERGHRGSKSNFATDGELFRLIKNLAALRKSNKVLTRGDLKMLATDEFGPGVLAYKRTYKGDSIIVLMNTAEHSVLVSRLSTGLNGFSVLSDLLSRESDTLILDNDGSLTKQLNAREFLILKDTNKVRRHGKNLKKPSFRIDDYSPEKTKTGDFEISGRTDTWAKELRVLVNGNLDRSIPVVVDKNGRFTATIPVRDLGEFNKYFTILNRSTWSLSERYEYKTKVTTKTAQTISDPSNDNRGPEGKYFSPQHQYHSNQTDIVGTKVQYSGANLRLIMTMSSVTDAWIPFNGFDNVNFSIFVDLPGKKGARKLPLLFAEMPENLEWNLGHIGGGWNNYMYSSNASSEDKAGERLGFSPSVSVDKSAKTISFLYEGSKLGVADWKGAKFYITTWDVDGEGTYREITEKPSEWMFGGGKIDDPLIMDDMLFEVK